MSGVPCSHFSGTTTVRVSRKAAPKEMSLEATAEDRQRFWRAVADRSRHEMQQPEKPGRRRLTAEFGSQSAMVMMRSEDSDWLVIPQRVQYKLAATVHRCLRHRAPWYFAKYYVPVSKVPGRHHLRSPRCHQLSVPRVRRSTFGTRAFLSPD